MNLIKLFNRYNIAIEKDKITIDDHLIKLFNRYNAALNRWEISFNDNNGNVSRLERQLSRKAYAAYHEWKTAEIEEV